MSNAIYLITATDALVILFHGFNLGMIVVFLTLAHPVCLLRIVREIHVVFLVSVEVCHQVIIVIYDFSFPAIL